MLLVDTFVNHRLLVGSVRITYEVTPKIILEISCTFISRFVRSVSLNIANQVNTENNTQNSTSSLGKSFLQISILHIE